MSIEQANAFRTFVNENESVQDQINGSCEWAATITTWTAW